MKSSQELNTEASVLTYGLGKRGLAPSYKLTFTWFWNLPRKRRNLPADKRRLVMSNACGPGLLTTNQCLMGKGMLLSLGPPSGLHITWQLKVKGFPMPTLTKGEAMTAHTLL